MQRAGRLHHRPEPPDGRRRLPGDLLDGSQAHRRARSGAEILGVDLSKDFPEKEIRKAFLEHQVIFFRDQKLDPAQFMAFARRMGRPIEYPFVKGIEGFPEVIEVKKLEHERHNFGGIWHSDTAYLEEPPMGSMLLAREIPPYGGDTLFASQYLAYEALSDGMKRLLDGLVAVNASAKADVTRTREDRGRRSTQGSTRPSTRWCARIRRPAARRST